MTGSAFVLNVGIPREVEVEGHTLSREDFYSWLWEEFLPHGLQGVHEGTLLSEQAAQDGLEGDAWMLDSAEAPRDRDWIGNQEISAAELYFSTEIFAHEAAERLKEIPMLKLAPIREQPQQDWDAQWKASFLGNAEGVKVSPCWRILPPWVPAGDVNLAAGEKILRINPGAGFGTGTHETTQLCLEAIGERAQFQSLQGQAILDFGSGSGILSIGAALLGAQVQGVEVDSLAIDNALENAQLNGVENAIVYSRTLSSVPGPFPVVIANILKPVLLEFASELTARLQPGGTVILSGLLEKDVKEVTECYSALLQGRAPLEKKSGEWRALVWN
jgi:ribosomal protein L11 methyltransferase